MKERLNSDIKAALLRGDAATAQSLRFIKNSLEQVEKTKGSELTSSECIELLRKEAKKRQEAAELFRKGGNQQSADKEITEAELIKGYLPPELSEDTIKATLLELLAKNEIAKEPAAMGKLMGLAKAELGDTADSSVIARIAVELLKGNA